MSFPMGGHPKLARFIEFAQEQGCMVDISTIETGTGEEISQLKIVNPKGGHVIVVRPDLDEYLTPSSVTYYQRRLGIKTPFNSAPQQTDDPTA